MLDHPDQKKNHRGRWITFMVAVPLLSVIFGVYTGFLYATRPTPEKTLLAFCRAVQSGDDLQAYSQYSNAYQHTYPKQQSENDLSVDKVISCTYGAVMLSGNKATTRMRLVHASGVANTDTVNLSQEGGSNNEWKIESGIHLSTPLETVNAFCNAIQNGDYQMAYTQLSENFQKTVSKREFVSAFAQSKMTTCSHNSLTISGTSATAMLKLVSAFSPEYSDVVILVQDS